MPCVVRTQWKRRQTEPGFREERDLMLAHLHDYASNSTVLDDSEHVGIYEVTAGKMQQQDQVQLSCPFVEASWSGTQVSLPPTDKITLILELPLISEHDMFVFQLLFFMNLDPACLATISCMIVQLTWSS
eukprot:g17683.t1